MPGVMPGSAGGSAAPAAVKKFEPGRVHQRHNAFADDDEDEAEEEVQTHMLFGGVRPKDRQLFPIKQLNENKWYWGLTLYIQPRGRCGSRVEGVVGWKLQQRSGRGCGKLCSTCRIMGNSPACASTAIINGCSL